MRARVRPILLVALASLALASCGSSVSGIYRPAGNAPYQQIEFSSGDTVDLTVSGTDRRGTYKIDGEKVILTIDGESIVFTVDDKGCLEGGGLIGTYCK